MDRSASSDLATPSSDVDLCVQFPDHERTTARLVEILEQSQRVSGGCPEGCAAYLYYL